MRKFSKKMCTVFAMMGVLTISSASYSQDSTKTSVDFVAGVDIYSRYIWRGAQIGSLPSIQPSLKMVCGNLTIGTWGAYQFDAVYPECDIYASYSLPAGFGISVTDYYISPSDANLFSYFDYSSDTTAHTFEGSLSFTGPEKFPISALFGYNFMGIDGYEGAMYGELSYPVKNFSFIVGAGNKVYSGKDDFALVNVGAKVVKNIEITDKFTLPVTVQLMVNPETKKTMFAVGLTF